MRLLRRNTQTVYYSTYSEKTYATDDDGYKTGEFTITYNEPVELVCNVSAASGSAQSEIFGNIDGYSRVIVTDDTDIDIDENTVFCIDDEPEYSDGTLNYNYIVKKVAKSLNSVSILVSKVTVE